MERRQFLKSMAWVAALQPAGALRSVLAGGEAAADPVRIARTLRVFVLEHGELWDVKRVADVLVKSGANAIRCDVGIYRGLVTMYPSRYLPPHPRLGTGNRLRELVDECNKHGVGVFVYNIFSGSMSPAVLDLHPQWAGRRVDGYPLPRACQNNPDYGSTYADACKEMVSGYELIGMYFDGPGEPDLRRLPDGRVEEDYCFCEHCRKAFAQMFGREMPRDLSRQHEREFRSQLLAVHMHGIELVTSTVSREIKSVRNIPVFINLGWPTIRVIRHPAMKYVDGALAAEIHRDTGFGQYVQENYMNSLADLKTGLAFGKAAWSYCPIGPHEQHVTYDNLETKIFGLTQLSHGGTPVMQTLEAFLYDQTGLSAVREVFAHMEKHGTLYADYRPVPFLALHCSGQAMAEATARDPRQPIGHWQNNHFRGAFAALTNAHQQFDVVLDDALNPDTLRKYRVLYLPNSRCLSDQQAEAVRDFVAAGGGLVATHQTSLADDHGQPRDDFALGDIFRASYRGVQQLEFGRLGDGNPYLHITEKHPVTDRLPVGKLIACLREPFSRVAALPGGQVVADMYVADTGEDFHPIQFPKDAPGGVIAATHDRGRVVYIAPAIDVLYLMRGFRLVRELMASAIEWVTRAESPLKLEAPVCVTTNLSEKGNRRLLHLINYTGDMRESPAYKVDWVAPLSNLRIGLRPPEGRRLAKATLLGKPVTLPAESANGYDWVVLPRLEVYECVVFDYA